MDLAKYEFQSEFARRYIALGKEQGKAEGNAEGKAEGKAQGRADLLTRQLTLRFGPLSDDALAQISAASIEELDAIGERLLTALSLQEALSLQP
jgi:flagellar biosynthesis/type III secretory pathway protein FliH